MGAQGGLGLERAERHGTGNQFNQKTDRPDRVIMHILHEMPKDSVERISPESLRLKLWNKVPMLIFVNLAAMTSSMSEMFMSSLSIADSKIPSR